MAALYQWYLENGGSKPECHPGTSLRNQTIKWLRELYEEDPGLAEDTAERTDVS